MAVFFIPSTTLAEHFVRFFVRFNLRFWLKARETQGTIYYVKDPRFDSAGAGVVRFFSFRFSSPHIVAAATEKNAYTHVLCSGCKHFFSVAFAGCMCAYDFLWFSHSGSISFCSRFSFVVWRASKWGTISMRTDEETTTNKNTATNCCRWIQTVSSCNERKFSPKKWSKCINDEEKARRSCELSDFNKIKIRFLFDQCSFA